MTAVVARLSLWARKADPSKLFLAIALPLGGLLCVLTPPFMVPDEQAHFFRAYQLSQGGLLAERFDGGVGGNLPKSLVDSSIVLIGNLPGQPGAKVQKKLIFAELSRPHKADDRTNIHFENTALYSPIAYLPTSIGVGMGRVLDASPLVMLYLGRLFTMLAWVGLTFLAFRLIPIARWVFLVVALAPMAIFQAASVSADALTLSLCFVATAWFVRLCLQTTTVTKKQWVATIGLVLVLGCVKQPYALLGLLFVAIPAKQLAVQTISRWQWVGSVVGALGATAGGWYLISKNFFMQSPFLLDRVLQPDQQLVYMLQHPLGFMKTIVLTHFAGAGDTNIREIVGVFGWLDAPMPFWAVLLYIGCLAVAVGFAYREQRIPRFQRWVMAGLALAVVLAIDFLLYMYWNAVGAPVIMGIQGRYYLMVLPLVMLALVGSYAISFKRISGHLVVLGGLAVVWMAALLTITLRFY